MQDLAILDATGPVLEVVHDRAENDEDEVEGPLSRALTISLVISHCSVERITLWIACE